MHMPAQVHNQNLHRIHRRPLRDAGISISSLTCRLSANLNKSLGCPDLEDTRPTAWAIFRCAAGLYAGSGVYPKSALDLQPAP